MFDIQKYLRLEMFPHMLCPGCGHGIVLGALLRAIDSLKLSQNEVVVVSGIGCSSRLSGYVDFDTLHTTHGRPLAFATGIKMARPELTVIVITGDGDGLSIGGNHLIHAARRNVGLTCLLLNNEIYGMTGGQAAPTTPLERSVPRVQRVPLRLPSIPAGWWRRREPALWRGASPMSRVPWKS